MHSFIHPLDEHLCVSSVPGTAVIAPGHISCVRIKGINIDLY